MSPYIKKILSVTILLLFVLKVFAPSRSTLVIIDTSPTDPFRNLIHAVGMVETKFDTLAYNPVEEAVGYFQIRPIRLKDYNKRTGNHYKKNDLYKYDISEKIFLYYASEIGPYNFERIAKEWNGSGKKTIQYWKKVKKYL
jgi:hypothetical protein